MNKEVLPAAVGSDEAEAFGAVEPPAKSMDKIAYDVLQWRRRPDPSGTRMMLGALGRASSLPVMKNVKLT